MNIKIQQNYRIEIASVEKLQDIKARTGIFINELVNKMIKLGIESFQEQEIDSAIEKKAEQKSKGCGTLGQDLFGEGDPDEFKGQL